MINKIKCVHVSFFFYSFQKVLQIINVRINMRITNKQIKFIVGNVKINYKNGSIIEPIEIELK